MSWVRYAMVSSLLCGCNLRKLTVDQTSNVLVAGAPTMDREEDVELAAQALPSQLKMIEALLESSPHNENLLGLAAQAYTQYAFGFVEDEMEAARATDHKRSEALRRRARALYLRGMQFGLRMLGEFDDRFPSVFYAGDGELKDAIAKHDRDSIKGLFYAGFGLAGAINLGKDDPALIAWLPKIEIFMMRVRELDERFQYGGSLLTLGAFWASRTRFFGGDPERGKAYFDRAVKLYPNYLMTKVIYARTYAVQTQDRKTYERLLGQVVDAKTDVMPEQRLANELARRRAQRYLTETDDLF
jgi:TRAP transporter TatT component family protein